MKTRVSLSIDSELLRELDRRAGKESRSGAAERALRNFLGADSALVLLAGGPAESLAVSGMSGSANASLYRPLVEAGGRTLVENALAQFRRAGVNRAIIVGSRNVNAAIFAKIGSGESLGVKAEYVQEDEHDGSAHTLSLALPRVQGTFAFAACDHYFDFDMDALRQTHESQSFGGGRGVSLALYAGTGFEWSKTSVVELNGSRISKYYEKPSRPASHVIATMLGFASAQAFAGIPLRGSLDHVFSQLSERGALYGFPASGNFFNIHSIKDVEAARAALRR